MKPFSPPNFNGVPVPYSASFAELKSYLYGPEPQVWSAFVALGHHPGREALELLVQFAASDDWRYRRSAIEALAFHPQGRDAANVVLMALLDSSPFVVRTACQVCAWLQLENCHTALLELIGAGESATRIAALGALESHWQPADLDYVLSIARYDANEDVRRRASWTLRANVGPINWRAIYETWKDDHPPRHRVWACELAAQHGDRLDAALIADLSSLATDPDGHVRKRARLALRALHALSAGQCAA